MSGDFQEHVKQTDRPDEVGNQAAAVTGTSLPVRLEECLASDDGVAELRIRNQRLEIGDETGLHGGGGDGFEGAISQ